MVKKVNSVRSKKNKGLVKYGELILGAYLLEKLRSEKHKEEIEPEVLAEPEEVVEPEELELEESGKRYSMRLGKVVMGALIGVTAMYALKRHSSKKSGHRIAVE